MSQGRQLTTLLWTFQIWLTGPGAGVSHQEVDGGWNCDLLSGPSASGHLTA